VAKEFENLTKTCIICCSTHV